MCGTMLDGTTPLKEVWTHTKPKVKFLDGEPCCSASLVINSILIYFYRNSEIILNDPPMSLFVFRWTPVSATTSF